MGTWSPRNALSPPNRRANQRAPLTRRRGAGCRPDMRMTRNARRYPARWTTRPCRRGAQAQDVTAAARRRLARFLAVFGPGLVVMLADTDVGSVITAGQSGCAVGLPPAGAAVRADPDPLHGAGTDRPARHLHRPRPRRTDPRHVRPVLGLGRPPPAWAIATVGALLTEFSGVAGVGELYGVPRVGIAADRRRRPARGGASPAHTAGWNGRPSSSGCSSWHSSLSPGPRIRIPCAARRQPRHPLRQQGLSLLWRRPISARW